MLLYHNVGMYASYDKNRLLDLIKNTGIEISCTDMISRIAELAVLVEVDVRLAAPFDIYSFIDGNRRYPWVPFFHPDNYSFVLNPSEDEYRDMLEEYHKTKNIPYFIDDSAVFLMPYSEAIAKTVEVKKLVFKHAVDVKYTRLVRKNSRMGVDYEVLPQIDNGNLFTPYRNIAAVSAKMNTQPYSRRAYMFSVLMSNIAVIKNKNIALDIASSDYEKLRYLFGTAKDAVEIYKTLRDEFSHIFKAELELPFIRKKIEIRKDWLDLAWMRMKRYLDIDDSLDKETDDLLEIYPSGKHTLPHYPTPKRFTSYVRKVTKTRLSDEEILLMYFDNLHSLERLDSLSEKDQDRVFSNLDVKF